MCGSCCSLTRSRAVALEPVAACCLLYRPLMMSDPHGTKLQQMPMPFSADIAANDMATPLANKCRAGWAMRMISANRLCIPKPRCQKTLLPRIPQSRCTLLQCMLQKTILCEILQSCALLPSVEDGLPSQIASCFLSDLHALVFEGW